MWGRSIKNRHQVIPVSKGIIVDQTIGNDSSDDHSEIASIHSVLITCPALKLFLLFCTHQETTSGERYCHSPSIPEKTEAWRSEWPPLSSPHPLSLLIPAKVFSAPEPLHRPSPCLSGSPLMSPCLPNFDHFCREDFRGHSPLMVLIPHHSVSHMLLAFLYRSLLSPSCIMLVYCVSVSAECKDMKVMTCAVLFTFKSPMTFLGM